MNCFVSGSPVIPKIHVQARLVCSSRFFGPRVPQRVESARIFSSTVRSVARCSMEGLGSRVLVLGGTGGLGTAVVRDLCGRGCQVAATLRRGQDSDAYAEISGIKCEDGEGKVTAVPNIDVAKDDALTNLERALKEDLKWDSIDSVISVVGLFTTDTLEDLNPEGIRAMYEVCVIGPLRVLGMLVNKGYLKEGSKVGMVTSEGGSIGLRSEKEGGTSYGHHMSKAAQNMMGRIFSLDAKPKGIAVVCLHPGFIRTTMTEHYAWSYDELGAVEPEVSAKGVVDAVQQLTLDTTGRFVQPLGSKSLGFGIYGLPDAEKRGPMSELPW